MLLKTFRSYALAVEFYRLVRAQIQATPIPSHLRDQLLRASSSIVLNLSEGSARGTQADRKRFYNIAFASLREVQSIFDLEETLGGLASDADVLAAHLYKLTRF